MLRRRPVRVGVVFLMVDLTAVLILPLIHLPPLLLG
jgi:hypothetical protein